MREETTTKDRFYKKRLLGQLALREKKITQQQLNEIIKKQIQLWESGTGKKLGQLMVEQGLLCSEDVHELLKKQQAMDRIRKRTFKPGDKRKGSKVKDETVNSLIVQYKQGDVIFKEGDESHRDLFVIQNGEVGVYRDSIHLGKRFEKGAFLGTTSCLLKTPRVSTAVALTATSMLRIPELGVESFFAKNPQMSLKLSSVLAKRLLNLTEQYVHEVKKDKIDSEEIDDNMLLGVASSQEVIAEKKVAGKQDDIAGVAIEEVAENNKEKSLAANESGDVAQEIISKSQEEDSEQRLAVVDSGVSEDVAGNEGDESFLVVDDLTDKEVGTEEKEEKSAVDPQDIDSESQQSTGGEEDEGEGEKGDNSNTPELDENGEPISVDPINEIMQEADSSVVLPFGELKDIVEAEKPLEFTDKIRVLLDKRLEMYLKLDEISIRRNELEAKESTTDRAKNELSSLRRELNKIPPYEPLKMKCDKLADMIAPAAEDAGDAAKPKLSKDVIQAYEISVEQKRLLLYWYDSMREVTEICSEVAQNQLMYKVLLKVGVNPVQVFGWAVYALAMQEYLQELRAKNKELKVALKKIREEEAANSSGGLLKLFKKKPEISEEEFEAKEKKKAELEAQELESRLKLGGITKELAQVEVVMVEAFWAVYGALGLRLVAGVDKMAEPFVRAYLRWGVLGLGSDFMESELLVKLLEDCKSGAQLPEFTMENNYILYADEVIELTAGKKLLPSPNEELELNERNSPRWKADRAHRKIVGGEFYLCILKKLQENLEADAEGKREQQAAKEKELSEIADDDPDKKKKTIALKKSIQAFKVAVVKAEKLVEKARDDMIPKLAEEIQDGKEAIEQLGIEVEPEDLARHEIICIRRFCRLIAKLKEPFLPFTLRDKFNPNLKTTNTREDLSQGLKDIEIKDPLIFKENMLATMKKNNRVQIRTSPFIHILPASGGMGFLVAPRTDTYSGKLLIPGYFERTGQREDVLVELLSDFRYDTSKEQAGNDVMNSDTLVAAYAEVRWILRKKDKEVRQKAGIFTDENERTNWRRHYAMYINSAFDSGKQLFFKCPDLYELIINKFIELPEGLEVLKRG